MEEEEEEEGRAEGVPEDREDEVSTGEEAVREGVMGKESIEENGKSKEGATCNTEKRETNGLKKKLTYCNK